MKFYSVLLLVFSTLISFYSHACSELSPTGKKIRDNRYPNIFVGKITEREILRNNLGVTEGIKFKFLPIKVKKGEISLDEEFWFPTKENDLTFIKGNYAYIFADKDNQIMIGDWCHWLSIPLGKVTPKDIDTRFLDMRLENATESDSRTELLWAKSHIQAMLKKITGKNDEQYWKDKLQIINKRLIDVY